MAWMQAAAAPQPPSGTQSAASAVVSSPSSPESPETVQQKRRRTEELKRKGEAAAGTGEGGDKGGQAVASGEGAEVETAGAGGQGEERGEQAAARRPADPFILVVSDRLGGLVVDDILVVSKDEGYEARRMAVEGGQGQPRAPNVPAAAMKSILPEVLRKEEVKGRRGRAGKGHRSTHRKAWPDKQGRERAGGGDRSQACDRAPKRERGKRAGATVAVAPTLRSAAAVGVAPTRQRGGAGGGGEGGALPPDGAVQGAGAHGAPAPSPPRAAAGARHHLPAGDDVRD